MQRGGTEKVRRLSLHPGGLGKRIVNLGQWRAHPLARLRRQVAMSADPVLAALAGELRAYPVPAGPHEDTRGELLEPAAVVPLVRSTPSGTLRFISTTNVSGSPVDVTLSGLALETLFPADAATARTLRRHVGDGAGQPGGQMGNE